MDEYSVYNNWYQSKTVLGGQTTAGFRAPVSHNIAVKQKNLTELEARISKVLNEAAESWTGRLMETYDRVFEKFQQQLRQKIQIPSEMAVEKEEVEVEFPKGGEEINLKKEEEVEVLFPISGDKSNQEEVKKTPNPVTESNPEEQKTRGNRSGGGGDFAGGFVGGVRSSVVAGIHGGGEGLRKMKRRENGGQRGGCGSGGDPRNFADLNVGGAAENTDGGNASMETQVRMQGREAEGSFVSCGSGGGPGIVIGVLGGGRVGSTGDYTGGGAWWQNTVVKHGRFCPYSWRSFEELGVWEKDLEMPTQQKNFLVEATDGIMVIYLKDMGINGIYFINKVRKGKVLVGSDGEVSEIIVDVTITNPGAHIIYQNISLVNGGRQITCSILWENEVRPNIFSIHFCNPSFPLIPSSVKNGPMAENFFSQPIYLNSPSPHNLSSYYPYQFSPFSYHLTPFRYFSNQLHVNELDPFTQSLSVTLFQEFNFNQRQLPYGDTSTSTLQHKSLFAVQSLNRILSGSINVLCTSDKFLQWEWYMMGVAKSNYLSESETYEKILSTVQGKVPVVQSNPYLGRTIITSANAMIKRSPTSYPWKYFHSHVTHTCNSITFLAFFLTCLLHCSHSITSSDAETNTNLINSTNTYNEVIFLQAGARLRSLKRPSPVYEVLSRPWVGFAPFGRMDLIITLDPHWLERLCLTSTNVKLMACPRSTQNDSTLFPVPDASPKTSIKKFTAWSTSSSAEGYLPLHVYAIAKIMGVGWPSFDLGIQQDNMVGASIGEYASLVLDPGVAQSFIFSITGYLASLDVAVKGLPEGITALGWLIELPKPETTLTTLFLGLVFKILLKLNHYEKRKISGILKHCSGLGASVYTPTVDHCFTQVYNKYCGLPILSSVDVELNHDPP